MRRKGVEKRGKRVKIWKIKFRFTVVIHPARRATLTVLSPFHMAE